VIEFVGDLLGCESGRSGDGFVVFEHGDDVLAFFGEPGLGC